MEERQMVEARMEEYQMAAEEDCHLRQMGEVDGYR